MGSAPFLIDVINICVDITNEPSVEAVKRTTGASPQELQACHRKSRGRPLQKINETVDFDCGPGYARRTGAVDDTFEHRASP
jgi:hypothetical protein